MNEIEKLIAELCPNGVEWKELGDKDVARLSRGKVMSKQFLEENKGEYPVYSSQTANNGEIGKISSFEFDGEYITWTTDGANAGTVFYRQGKFSITNVCGLVAIQHNKLLVKFVYYYLTISAKKYVSSGMGNPKLMSNVMAKIKIPIPPLKIQKKIVQILDKFTNYVTELTSELTLRQKQYSFYRDKLLSFEDEVYQVEWKTLGEVAVLKNGRDWKSLSRGSIPVYGSGGEMGEFVAEYAYNKPTVLIPRKGSISNLFYLEKPFWNVDTIYYTEIDHSNILPKYFYYYLKTVDLESMATNPTRPSLTQSILEKIEIPVPSLQIQERIVEVLDNFDTVCNDLKIGLPKEIELRQKQYEYFRDKLLTFTAEGVYTDSTVQTRPD
ncbi:putative type-1 restriction enzyme specificity protein MG438 [Streptococcus infantarius subsp. infantarius]|nr:putative type-1 restriction enzyme specificity protein MG438 [Streptococcus infantarius subsp. infantarius]